MSSGREPLLVLVPGIRGDTVEWRALVPRLRGWRVHLVALPEDAGPSIRAVADRVAASLPDEPAHVVGASFGGLVAWALPAERVRSVTTIGTLPWPTPRAHRCRYAALALRALPDRAYVELYGPRARASMEEDGADAPMLEQMRLPTRRAFADRLAAIARWDLPPRPPATATWMWGATDRFVTWDAADVRKAGFEPLVVPGGHRPHVSHPTEVARWISPDTTR